jgi:Ca2+-dependent lipid-binding protein
MEKKEYLVGVTIIEGRKLSGKDAAGTSDPFVKITCANMPQQVTQRKYETNATVWNQSFTFPGVLMNQYELETFELILEVYDYNAVKTNELIG